MFQHAPLLLIFDVRCVRRPNSSRNDTEADVEMCFRLSVFTNSKMVLSDAVFILISE